MPPPYEERDAQASYPPLTATIPSNDGGPTRYISISQEEAAQIMRENRMRIIENTIRVREDTMRVIEDTMRLRRLVNYRIALYKILGCFACLLVLLFVYLLMG